VLLFTVAALLRLPLLSGEGLWADEFFSLAIATGHSLEHPAADANPMLDDFVQAREAMPAGAWGRYLAQEKPPAGIRRISRAVFMSDTSPPLYYVLLGYWTRGLGTSDAALRLFSLVWALASVPLLWLLARRLGGTRAAVLAVALAAARRGARMAASPREGARDRCVQHPTLDLSEDWAESHSATLGA